MEKLSLNSFKLDIKFLNICVNWLARKLQPIPQKLSKLIICVMADNEQIPIICHSYSIGMSSKTFAVH